MEGDPVEAPRNDLKLLRAIAWLLWKLVTGVVVEYIGLPALFIIYLCARYGDAATRAWAGVAFAVCILVIAAIWFGPSGFRAWRRRRQR